MTLTPEQIAEGWVPHNGGECPIKDDRTLHEVMLEGGNVPQRDRRASQWIWSHKGWGSDIIAYRIIEAHGADAEPARPTPMFDLQRSHDHPGEAHWKAERVLYNVIDMPGLFRGQIALTDDERHAIGGTIFAVSAQDTRPTPFPASYDELVFDDQNWSQTIIVDGKRPEWLRDDDGISAIIRTDGYSGHWNESWQWEIAIRVRRREPKRETVTGYILSHFITDRPLVTFDLIDGKPDLSTIKIAEDAL